MIKERYVLFVRIPLFRGSDGTYFAGDLWARDLNSHFEYIEDLNICCPVLDASESPEGVVAIPQLGSTQVFPIKVDHGWWSILANLIPNFRAVSKASRTGGIMHSSGSEWAFPLSYYLLVLRQFYCFRWLIVIESAFWMLPKEGTHPWHKRVSQALHWTLMRACLKGADARVFTQDLYREVLYGASDACLVSPATWIDEDLIVPHARTSRPNGPLHLVFPTRLTPEKGVRTLLEAIQSYEASESIPSVQIDVLGDGDLSDELNMFISKHNGKVALRRLPTKPYGRPFLEFLQSYDAVLVANRTEEQPRIIFDAFSQGIPCIASATNGNCSVLEPRKTGWTFEPGNAEALATVIAQAATDPDALIPMRQKALEKARNHTHAQMHRTREKFLKDVFGLL